jgi:hypothetical protein
MVLLAALMMLPAGQNWPSWLLFLLPCWKPCQQLEPDQAPAAPAAGDGVCELLHHKLHPAVALGALAVQHVPRC